MEEQSESLEQQWFDRKSALMEQMLGKEHEMVMHAIVPYAVGGGLDLYYYPNRIRGTAIATKELSEMPGVGSSNSVYRCYELVMFTRHPIDLDAARDKSHPFGEAHSRIQAILNHIAPYSAQATLHPNETCEFPSDMPRVGGRCLIFDGYPSYSANEPAEFGLMAVIEVFRSEMMYARKRGGANLLQRLKDKGYYPYSDLDRRPVA
ncbi:MAG: suppressor of fused domain protein [Fimbriimonadaceae bacterium]|nr:suppressor of fused domain protein [Fimbriimonadaceae bacterium]